MKNIQNSFKKITALALIIALSFSFSVPIEASAACDHSWKLFSTSTYDRTYYCAAHRYCIVNDIIKRYGYGCLKCGGWYEDDVTVSSVHTLYQ